MKRKIDLTVFMGVTLFSFGLISISYGIIALIITVPFGYIGIIVYTKDVLFDLVFLLLGFILIRRNKKVKF
ncbi:MAG: hypothetical protein KGD65_05885 [Candidatus Lokiarchaeota archaeon]|nr:hypothetical protein [Candidatus Lokiarchaeota archaeon]